VTCEELICLMCSSHGDHRDHEARPIDEFATTARTNLASHVTTIDNAITRTAQAISAVEAKRDLVTNVFVLYELMSMMQSQHQCLLLK
jgi:hypothetical protein